MKLFTKLYSALDHAVNSDSKEKALLSYLEKASDQDVLWMLGLVLGKKPKRTLRGDLLKEWVILETDLPPWLLEESIKVVGDMAETVAIVLSEPSSQCDYSLSHILDQVIAMGKMDESEKKEEVFKLWRLLNKDERVIFNKIVCGNFRLEVSKKTIIKCLAKHLNQTDFTISYRIHQNWHPKLTSYKSLLVHAPATEKLSKPYPLYHTYNLEKNIQDLGSAKLWAAEYKWAGVRGQIIKRDGEIFVWARGEELVTEKFPEYQILKEIDLDNFVMDGEIVSWLGKSLQPINQLEKRFNRKNLDKKLLRALPISFVAYDLLEYEKNDIRALNFNHRRKQLENIIAGLDRGDIFSFSDEIEFNSWSELAPAREAARKYGAEGLIIKKMDSTYLEGRKMGEWWKWKSEPFKVMAVLLYATRGPGPQSKLFSDFTFAVSHNGTFIPFVKTAIGLTDKDLETISGFVKSNTLESFGPVKSLTPLLVFEVSFESISRSSRHKSGISVRSPKIIQLVKDLTVADINSLDDLYRLLPDSL